MQDLNIKTVFNEMTKTEGKMYHVSRTDSHYVYFLICFVECNLIIASKYE